MVAYSDEPLSNWNTSSTRTPKVEARRKANSKDETYFPASRAT